MRIAFAFWSPAAGGGAAPALSAMSTDVVDTAGGGKALVLTGSNFLADGPATPKLDGVAFAAFTIDSDTQITCTVPAHAPGTGSVTVTNANGSSGALSLEFWDPSVPATPTGDWRDYAGAPWANAGSVGGDASDSFYPATIGSPLNGHGTADFVHPQNLGTSAFVDHYVPAAGFELLALLKVRTTQPSGAAYDDPAIFSDPYMNIGVTDDGVQATIFSSGWQASGYHPFTAGAWRLVNVSHDGVNASLSVDNDTPTTWPVGLNGRPNDTYPGTIGRSAPSAVTTLDHLLARLITYPAPLTAGDRVNAQKYFTQKYDL